MLVAAELQKKENYLWYTRSVSLCTCGQVHSMGHDFLLVFDWRYFNINTSSNLVLLQYY